MGPERMDRAFALVDEMRLVPVGYSMKLRCKICRELHELKLSEAWVRKTNGKSF
jgi:hypothetical protein